LRTPHRPARELSRMAHGGAGASGRS
jgi:hypothetical protein